MTATSLSAELGRPVTVTDMVGAVEHHLADVLAAATWQRPAGLPHTTAPAAGAAFQAAVSQASRIRSCSLPGL